MVLVAFLTYGLGLLPALAGLTMLPDWLCCCLAWQHLSEVAAVAASDAEHSLALSLALKVHQASPLSHLIRIMLAHSRRQ